MIFIFVILDLILEKLSQYKKQALAVYTYATSCFSLHCYANMDGPNSWRDVTTMLSSSQTFKHKTNQYLSMWTVASVLKNQYSITKPDIFFRLFLANAFPYKEWAW